ncbi:VCBS repeat-containing protein, partial [Streptomyces rochei]
MASQVPTPTAATRATAPAPRASRRRRAPLDLSQETPGVPGSGQGASEAGDHFGASLAVGDLDGDGHAD